MQRGEIKRIGRPWYLRFYRDELQDGQRVRARLEKTGEVWRLEPLAERL